LSIDSRALIRFAAVKEPEKLRAGWRWEEGLGHREGASLLIKGSYAFYLEDELPKLLKRRVQKLQTEPQESLFEGWRRRVPEGDLEVLIDPLRLLRGLLDLRERDGADPLWSQRFKEMLKRESFQNISRLGSQHRKEEYLRRGRERALKHWNPSLKALGSLGLSLDLKKAQVQLRLESAPPLQGGLEQQAPLENQGPRVLLRLETQLKLEPLALLWEQLLSPPPALTPLLDLCDGRLALTLSQRGGVLGVDLRLGLKAEAQGRPISRSSWHIQTRRFFIELSAQELIISTDPLSFKPKKQPESSAGRVSERRQLLMLIDPGRLAAQLYNPILPPRPFSLGSKAGAAQLRDLEEELREVHQRWLDGLHDLLLRFAQESGPLSLVWSGREGSLEASWPQGAEAVLQLLERRLPRLKLIKESLGELERRRLALMEKILRLPSGSD